MNTLLIILILLIAIIGIIGSFVPVIPGPPISFLSIFLLDILGISEIANPLLWMIAIFAFIITLLDFYLPAYLVKIGKGSRIASNGAGVGAIIGFFFLPFGILIGPLLGAFIGETLNGSSIEKSFQVSLYAFLGFLSGVFLKFLFSIYVLIKIILHLF